MTDRSHSYLSTNNQWLFNRAHSHILEKARIIEQVEEFYLSSLLVKDNNVDKILFRMILIIIIFFLPLSYFSLNSLVFFFKILTYYIDLERIFLSFFFGRKKRKLSTPWLLTIFVNYHHKIYWSINE